MPTDPLLAAVLVWIVAHALAASMWFTLRLPSFARASILVPVGAACFFAPLLLARDPIGPLVFAAVTCPVMALKLLDLHIGASWWRTQSPWLWVRLIPMPFVLVGRRYVEEPVRPRSQNLRMLARGLLEVAFGYWLLKSANAWDLGATSFWLEHYVKALACYALAFDGGMVVVCATLRLLGLHVMEFSRHPIVSATPAEFWRRYNRPGGRFLYDNVFLPSGGKSAPLRGLWLVFVFNGLLHEGLLFLLVGRVMGLQLAFFVLHALAVSLTFRLRPRGAWVWVGRVLTFLFVIATGLLFLANVDAIAPGWVYPYGSPLS